MEFLPVRSALRAAAYRSFKSIETCRRARPVPRRVAVRPSLKTCLVLEVFAGENAGLFSAAPQNLKAAAN